MPVTARLSKRFYDQFGDDVANELVEWFNAVDTTYQTQLRELNELNFARFRAEMDARFAEFRVEMKADFATLETRLSQQIAKQKTEILFWFVMFWIGTVVAQQFNIATLVR